MSHFPLIWSVSTLMRASPKQELNHLTNSFAQLKQAQAKFNACISDVGEVKEGNRGKLVVSLGLILRLRVSKFSCFVILV